MYIKLKNGWVITTNPNNIILGRERIGQKGTKGEGETFVTPVGYYCTPITALRGYLKHEVRDSSVKSILELQEHYESVLNDLAKSLSVPYFETRKIERLEQEISDLKVHIKKLESKNKT